MWAAVIAGTLIVTVVVLRIWLRRVLPKRRKASRSQAHLVHAYLCLQL